MDNRRTRLGSIRMLSLLASTALLSLVMGSVHAQAPCPIQPYKSCEGLTPPELMSAMSRGPAEDCQAEDGLIGIGKKCRNLKVTVIAGTKEMPRCWAILNYSGLKVTKAKRNRTVSWELDLSQAAGHEFDAIEGIKLKPVSGSASSPTTTWSKHSSSGKTVFKLKVRDERPSAFCHYPQVKDPDGVLCCPADPVIANEPN